MHPRDHLLMAIKADKPEIVASLTHLVDLTKIIEKNYTPIELAAYLKNWNCVKVLIEKDPNIVKEYGYALFCAVYYNEIAIVRLLLEAKISDMNNSGNNESCLHQAVRNENAPMVALLLTFGFNFNEKNSQQQTPSDLAILLKTNCFNEGWEMYYQDECRKREDRLSLTLIVQGCSQDKSFFGMLPVAILNHIASLLCHPSLLTTKDHLQSRKDSMHDGFVKHLTKNFMHHGFFKIHSKKSKQFVHQLTETVNKDSCTTKDIAETMGPFLKDDKFKKTKKFFRLQNQYPRLLALEIKDSVVGAEKISVEITPRNKRVANPP